MAVLATFVRIVVEVLTFAILARVILSWLPLSPYNPLSQFLFSLTEPILAPLRRLIPRIGLLDITPLIAILILQLIATLLL